MDTDFPTLLRSLIDGKFRSRRKFVRAAFPHGNEDSLASALAKVLRGDLLPPLELVDAWADALSLTGDERETFLRLAYMSRAPAPIAALVARLEAENSAFRKLLLDVLAENARLRADLGEPPREIGPFLGNTPVGGRQGPGGGRISRGKPPGGAGAPDHA